MLATDNDNHADAQCEKSETSLLPCVPVPQPEPSAEPDFASTLHSGVGSSGIASTGSALAVAPPTTMTGMLRLHAAYGNAAVGQSVEPQRNGASQRAYTREPQQALSTPPSGEPVRPEQPRPVAAPVTPSSQSVQPEIVTPPVAIAVEEYAANVRENGKSTAAPASAPSTTPTPTPAPVSGTSPRPTSGAVEERAQPTSGQSARQADASQTRSSAATQLPATPASRRSREETTLPTSGGAGTPAPEAAASRTVPSPAASTPTGTLATAPQAGQGAPGEAPVRPGAGGAARGGGAPATGGGAGGASETPALDTSSAEGLIQSLATVPASSFPQALSQAKTAAPGVQGQERAALEAEFPEVEQPTGLPRRSERPRSAAVNVQAGDAPEMAQPAGGAAPLPDTGHEAASGPLPASQARVSGGEPVAAEEEGSWWDWLFNAVRSFLGQISTSDPGLSTSAGERPRVQLGGETDPSRMQQHEESSRAAVQSTRAQGDAAANADFGENDIYPTVPGGMMRPAVGSGAPPAARLGGAVDLDYLKGLDMAGAGITSSARMAALPAADAQSPAISILRIVRAVFRQYQREARILSPVNLGPYASLAHEAP